MRIGTIARFFCVFALTFSCQDKEPDNISPPDVPVSSVRISPSSLEMLIGESKDLTAMVNPSNATRPTVFWESTNPLVATVSEYGSVSALSEGVATITATADGKTGSCSVTVSKPYIAVQSVTLDPNTLSLVEGDTGSLVVTISPEDATEKTITWNSSNTNVVSVNQDGMVTAVKAGTATITASVGGKSATCAVNVEPRYIAVQTVSLNKTSISLIKGEQQTLTATVKPDDATNKAVTWSSSDESVVVVDQYGIITAVGGGGATITAKAEEISATCTVTVSVPVLSVSLDITDLTIARGETRQLHATVNPEDATDKSVDWSSSDAALVNVNQNGLITAIEKGSATVTVNASGKTAFCTVSVKVPAESVSLDSSSLTLLVGQSITLTASILPADTTDNVVWSNSNETVVRVDNGKVTALKQGTAVVTVSVGQKWASCTFTVNAASGDNEGIGYEDW